MALSYADINQLLRVAVAASLSGNNTLVAAITGKKIVVVSGLLIAASAVTIKFQSGAGGTDLTGSIALPANGGFVIPQNEAGHFLTGSGALLNLNLSSGVSVAGWLNYILVPAA